MQSRQDIRHYHILQKWIVLTKLFFQRFSMNLDEVKVEKHKDKKAKIFRPNRLGQWSIIALL